MMSFPLNLEVFWCWNLETWILMIVRFKLCLLNRLIDLNSYSNDFGVHQQRLLLVPLFLSRRVQQVWMYPKYENFSFQSSNDVWPKNKNCKSDEVQKSQIFSSVLKRSVSVREKRWMDAFSEFLKRFFRISFLFYFWNNRFCSGTKEMWYLEVNECARNWKCRFLEEN